MKLCESCRYRNNTEYEKPCIVYRDNCEYYEKERGDMTDDLIRRQAVLYILEREGHKWGNDYRDWVDAVNEVETLPSVNPQEPKTGWNNHQIACMLADLFGDACACNYNGIDEWLGELCDFKDTCCPNPGGVDCWEQFLKYSQSRYTECGYEVRDKNALQEPKTGHWIPVSEMLPEEDDFYLVTAKVGNELIIDISEYTPKNDFWDIPHEIVAWMPLPKPYEPKPQESEEDE